MIADLCLDSLPRDPDAFADRVGIARANGARRLAILPDDDFAAAVRSRLSPVDIAPTDTADVLCLTHTDATALDEALLGQIDRTSGTVLIPTLPGHGVDRPLFLISIPKSGTHLLYRLAEALGFKPGVVCPDEPTGGHWYCVEYSNSHTMARDFFVDSVRRAAFGNRHHPFLFAPALFITRHPLDILVSEASYYGRPGNSAFADWFGGLDFAQTVARLVHDDVLLQPFADRMMAFVPWMSFSNVLTLAFEDIVGSQGGSDAGLQRALIWSIQVRLGLPGCPAEIGARLFDRNSPTFREGQTGAHQAALQSEALTTIAAAADRPLRAFGYTPGSQRSMMAERWRTKPVRIDPPRFDETPILIEASFLGYGLVRFRRMYYAVASGGGDVDLTTLSAAALSALPHARDLNALRATLIREPMVNSQHHETERLIRRIEVLESTVEERTERLRGLEAAMEERAGRLHGLEATLAERTERLLRLEAVLAKRTEGLSNT